MSWQPYIDTNLVGSGHIDKAAIFDNQGTAVWAASSGFQVSPEELKPIVASFADSSDVRKIASEGFHIAGQKYITVQSVGDFLTGKRFQAKDGIVVERTNQALIVAHHPENAILTNAATVVGRLATYLRQQGF